MKMLFIYFAFNIMAFVNERQEWCGQAMPRGQFFKLLFLGLPVYLIDFLRGPKKG
jgi:hypothetical protein